MPGVKDKTFLAEEAGTGARVALRVLDESARDGGIFETLREHAGRVTALAARCPAIAAIHECGRVDGAIYLALEHPSGPTLAETLQRDAPLPPERAVRLAIRIAEALESAHMLGIVHGSLTPRTVVLVGQDEAVKLTQFGIDWLRATRRSGRAGARAGVDGSPYAAPEQALSGEATPQSDVYALGAILYEALLGRPPAAPLSARRRGSIPPLRKARPEVTRSLERVVMHALESDPARRYRDMTDFFNDLWSEVNPFAGATASDDGGARRGPSTRAGWSRSIAVGIVLVVGGGIALLSWLLVGSSPEQVAAPRVGTPRPEPTTASAPPPPPASEPAPVTLPPAPPPAVTPPPAATQPEPARPPEPTRSVVETPPRPVVEPPARPVVEPPARPVVEPPARPVVETPRPVARPAPTPRAVAAPRTEPTLPARAEEGAAAAAPGRDGGEDAGAIIDWLLRESSSARR